MEEDVFCKVESSSYYLKSAVYFVAIRLIFSVGEILELYSLQWNSRQSGDF